MLGQAGYCQELTTEFECGKKTFWDLQDSKNFNKVRKNESLLDVNSNEIYESSRTQYKQDKELLQKTEGRGVTEW